LETSIIGIKPGISKRRLMVDRFRIGFSPIHVDSPREASNNCTMSKEILPVGNSELNDAIAHLMKGERDPEAVKKACERMDQIREETRKRVGIVDVAVEFVREFRDK
jgi:hypothetical protein